ncbi:hypothetical protein LOK46_02470 [Methylobacterium sp. NMS14P]|uniref:hypothetical protein n=1 Tax=Methylobacterium sp. NMS14P TaxID=2894310 RepID=UPI00235A325E|nr:hypothetical protein [Methylobacterium sp. NMS14P]WCS25722.1 hypothetical protein LOK46_02470 [Methylobacterium sp. NMS14P]
MAGPALSAPRRWWRAAVPAMAVLGLLALVPAPAAAQEPLYIRIRPLSDAEAARVAREMLWARRQAHARAVIESVCTGCLGAWKPEPVPAPAQIPAPAEDRIANLAVPIGVELDPGSGASGPHPDSSTSERHP